MPGPHIHTHTHRDAAHRPGQSFPGACGYRPGEREAGDLSRGPAVTEPGARRAPASPACPRSWRPEPAEGNHAPSTKPPQGRRRPRPRPERPGPSPIPGPPPAPTASAAAPALPAARRGPPPYRHSSAKAWKFSFLIFFSLSQ